LHDNYIRHSQTGVWERDEISPDDLETVFETSVLLTWNAATDPSSGFSLLDSTPATSYTNIDAGYYFQKLFYQVKAVDNDLVIMYWRDLSGNKID